MQHKKLNISNASSNSVLVKSESFVVFFLFEFLLLLLLFFYLFIYCALYIQYFHISFDRIHKELKIHFIFSKVTFDRLQLNESN